MASISSDPGQHFILAISPRKVKATATAPKYPEVISTPDICEMRPHGLPHHLQGISHSSDTARDCPFQKVSTASNPAPHLCLRPCLQVSFISHRRVLWCSQRAMRNMMPPCHDAASTFRATLIPYATLPARQLHLRLQLRLHVIRCRLECLTEGRCFLTRLTSQEDR